MKKVEAIVIATSIAAIVCGGIACGSSGADADSATGMKRVWFEELAVLAEPRLQCSRERLDYEYLGEKVHLIEGCGKQVRYMIFQRGELWVKIESFHERAAFELDCAVEQLASVREDEATWRVTGCDRQIRFTLSCDDDGLTCEWTTAPD
jgi:hypothetical protein